MRYLRIIFVVMAFISYGIVHADGSNPIASLAWQIGPSQASIGDNASIKIPDGFAFLGATEAKKFMELTQNIPGREEYVLAPTSLNWFAIFSFNPVGYVKDDETVDADEVLETVRNGTEAGNEIRRQKGWSTMSIVGWRFTPQYDQQTKLLEWAFLAKNDQDNSDLINYNTRLLGRTGVMEVVLVSSPAILDTAVATLKTALTGYEFAPGQKYTEFREGDHVAEFGLAALVAGGAAAAAAKKGFFAVIAGFFAAAWKLVIPALIGIWIFIKSIFRKKA